MPDNDRFNDFERIVVKTGPCLHVVSPDNTSSRRKNVLSRILNVFLSVLANIALRAHHAYCC